MDLFLVAINDSVPKIGVKSANSAPWIDAEVLKAVRKRDLESELKGHLLNITGQYFDCIVRNSNHLLNGSVSNASKVCH